MADDKPLTADIESELRAAGEKYCTSCGKRKKYEHFDRDKRVEDGRRENCKDCRSQSRRNTRQKKVADALVKMDEQGLEVLSEMRTGGSFAPHASELLESCMKGFGGVDGFGKHLYATFLAAPPGSARRVSILKIIMELVQENTKSGDADAKLDHLSSEDVARIMAHALHEYQTNCALESDAIPTLDGNVTSIEKLGVTDESK